MRHKKYTKERQERDTKYYTNIQKEYCNETEMVLLGQRLDKEMIQKVGERKTKRTHK